MRIIESYRLYAIESDIKLNPADALKLKADILCSDKDFKLTIDMPYSPDIKDIWTKHFKDPSQVKFLADNEIVDLYCRIKGAELIRIVNDDSKYNYLKDYALKSNTTSIKGITIKTIPIDGDLNIGTDLYDSPSDLMINVLDGEGHEVVIGTTFEIKHSYDMNYINRKRTEEYVRSGSCPKAVSATRKIFDSYWSNYDINLPEVKYSDKIDHYCSNSNIVTKLVNSNFRADEHEMVIDEVFNPGLQQGEDVVDSNEHEAVIGATVQEDGICTY